MPESGEQVAEMLAQPADPTERHTDPCEECDIRGISGRSGRTELYCSCRYGRRKHLEHFERIHDRFDHAGVPDQLRGVTLKSLRERAGQAVMDTSAVRAVRSILEGGVARDPQHETTHSGVCILGPNGLGKTGLLVILARSIYQEGFTPLFIKYLDLVKSVQAGYGAYADGHPRHELSTIRTETAQRVSHLFLDDLGDPFGQGESYDASKDRRDIIFRVLSARHERGRPTYITANYNADDSRGPLGQVADQFDPRIADRIKEMCAVTKLDGPNLRELK